MEILGELRTAVGGLSGGMHDYIVTEALVTPHRDGILQDLY
jgi:hypothetical protein